MLHKAWDWVDLFKIPNQIERLLTLDYEMSIVTGYLISGANWANNITSLNGYFPVHRYD